MLADYHVHTEYSDDSVYPMEEVVKDAVRMGLEELCFTDHVDYGTICGLEGKPKKEQKMTVSNYEIMRNRMRGEFVKYDQEKMIEKFKLDFDEAYLYLSFVCRDYRINRKNGIVEWSEDGFQSVTEGDYNESMTIYDVLCYSKEDCHLSGKFVPLYSAKGMAKGLHAADGSRMFQKTADSFQGHLGQLEAVCRSLGEPAGMSGDVAAVLRVFPFLPATFQFWEGDEEFPPSMKFMFDENILDYMHFETVYFMMSHILERMGEMLSIEVKNKKTAGYIRKTD